MQQLKSQHGSNFVSKNDVWSSCNGKMSNADFTQLIASLEEDGTIYQAGNPDTYCLTDWLNDLIYIKIYNDYNMIKVFKYNNT